MSKKIEEGDYYVLTDARHYVGKMITDSVKAEERRLSFRRGVHPFCTRSKKLETALKFKTKAEAIFVKEMLKAHRMFYWTDYTGILPVYYTKGVWGLRDE